jgi:hypothetical protein
MAAEEHAINEDHPFPHIRLARAIEIDANDRCGL